MCIIGEKVVAAGEPALDGTADVRSEIGVLGAFSAFNLVIIRPLGKLTDPLPFLLFWCRSDGADGDTGRDKIGCVIIAEGV